MNQLDLHMHTNVSTDGDYAPEALLQRCAASGLKTVAISDHNSTRAYPGAYRVAAGLGLNLISGVELDCQREGVSLHVLGYGIDPQDAAFARYEAYVTAQDQHASAARLAAVRGLGIHIAEEAIHALAVQGIITGEMLAEVALQDRRNDQHPLLQPYRTGGARSDNPYVNFYWDVCSQGKPAYVRVEYMSLDEGVAMIRAAGGLAVLAHPGINIGQDAQIFRAILGSGVRGVEAYSSYHSAATVQFYAELARAEGVLITIGSDFHGKTKPAIRLGSFSVADETAIHVAFLQAIAQNRKGARGAAV